MNVLLTVILILSFILGNSQGRKHIVKPNAQGYLYIENSDNYYKPGDTLLLSGHFKSVEIYNLNGTSKNRIYISNIRGETLIIGDTLWSGGGWSHGLMFKNCHYIKIAGSAKGKFNILGSKVDAVRASYFDLEIAGMSDNFDAHTITIRHGGTGVLCKSEVWRSDITLNNFNFYSLDISNTFNEAMYIGHTATWWDIVTNMPYYGTTPDVTRHKRPIKLKNVKIYNNRVSGAYNDGIQTAAIDNLRVYANTVWDYGKGGNTYHSCGILIGGRVKGFNVYNNYVYNGNGDLMQVFADSGTANIYNNLLVNTPSNGLFVRGSKGLAVNAYNNTIAYAGSACVRVNGFNGGNANKLTKNIFLQQGNNYIYLENNGLIIDLDNKKYASAAAAMLNENYFFQPFIGSPCIGYGYIKK